MDFFQGRASAAQLAGDLSGSMVRRGYDVVEHRIEEMDEHFALNADHLVRLCDAVIAGSIDPSHLETISFCLVASDRFDWASDTPEGDRIAEAIHDWAAPEINHPLTSHNVGQWRLHLLGQPTSFEQRSRRQRRKDRHARHS